MPALPPAKARLFHCPDFHPDEVMKQFAMKIVGEKFCWSADLMESGNALVAFQAFPTANDAASTYAEMELKVPH